MNNPLFHQPPYMPTPPPDGGVLRDLQVGKVAYLVKVTDNDLACAEVWPFTIPTAEARAAAKAERAAQATQFRVELEALLAKAHPALQPVIALHSPDQHSLHYGWTCKGCDAGAYAEDSAVWPCSTIDLVLEGLGDPVPGCDSHWMDGRNEVRCWAGTAGHTGPCR